MKKLPLLLIASTAILIMSSKGKAEETKEIEVRNPTATDQVFTPEYLDQINAERQAANAQRQQDSERHQKMLDFYTRQR